VPLWPHLWSSEFFKCGEFRDCLWSSSRRILLHGFTSIIIVIIIIIIKSCYSTRYPLPRNPHIIKWTVSTKHVLYPEGQASEIPRWSVDLWILLNNFEMIMRRYQPHPWLWALPSLSLYMWAAIHPVQLHISLYLQAQLSVCFSQRWVQGLSRG